MECVYLYVLACNRMLHVHCMYVCASEEGRGDAGGEG